MPKLPRIFALALLSAALQTNVSCQGKTDGRAPRATADLGAAVRAEVSQALSSVPGAVAIRLYRGKGPEVGSDESEALLSLMVKASDRVTGSIHDIGELPAGTNLLAPKHGPVFIMEGPRPMTARYLGYPADLELAPFLDGVLTTAGKEYGLSERTRAFLDGLKEPVFLRIFVSPG